MKDKKYLLSICIPTYNRCTYLDKTLENIISQINDLDYNVELIVSDNNSSDDTFNIVQKHIKKYNIKYNRNKTNIGFDGNFEKCFNIATGDYVWLLGDDDVLIPGSLCELKDALDSKPICIHINSCALNNNEVLLKEKRIKNKHNIILKNRNDFIQKTGIYFTYISANIYKKEYVNRIKNMKKYYGTNLLQSFVLLDIMNNKGIYYIDVNACVAEKGNLTVSYDVLKTWIESYKYLLLEHSTKCGFDIEIMKRLFIKNLKNEIYDFIICFKINRVDVKKWDSSVLDTCLKDYKRIQKQYKIIIKYPRFIVYFIKIKNGIIKKIKKVFNEE